MLYNKYYFDYDLYCICKWIMNMKGLKIEFVFYN